MVIGSTCLLGRGGEHAVGRHLSDHAEGVVAQDSATLLAALAVGDLLGADDDRAAAGGGASADLGGGEHLGGGHGEGRHGDDL